MPSSWRDPDPSEWPPLDHAQRIIDHDLSAMPDNPVRLTIREGDGVWVGAMWQRTLGGKRDSIDAVGLSQEEVVRHLAAIIKANRMGGVVP